MALGRVILLGLALALVPAAQGRGKKMKELTEEAAGVPVTLGVGDRLRVALHESGGTGYRWRAAPGCENVLHLEREEAGKPDDRPGAGSPRTWVYTATANGDCDLRFESARSWEKTATGKRVSFPVAVRTPHG